MPESTTIMLVNQKEPERRPIRSAWASFILALVGILSGCGSASSTSSTPYPAEWVATEIAGSVRQTVSAYQVQQATQQSLRTERTVQAVATLGAAGEQSERETAVVEGVRGTQVHYPCTFNRC